jgi:hypothetical protein
LIHAVSVVANPSTPARQHERHLKPNNGRSIDVRVLEHDAIRGLSGKGELEVWSQDACFAQAAFFVLLSGVARVA